MQRQRCRCPVRCYLSNVIHSNETSGALSDAMMLEDGRLALHGGAPLNIASCKQTASLKQAACRVMLVVERTGARPYRYKLQEAGEGRGVLDGEEGHRLIRVNGERLIPSHFAYVGSYVWRM